MLTRRRSWQGKGQQVGGGLLSLDHSQLESRDRVNSTGQVTTYPRPLLNRPGGLGEALQALCKCPHTPTARGLIPGVKRLVFF